MDTTFPDHFRWGVATSAHQVEGYNFHEYVARIPLCFSHGRRRQIELSSIWTRTHVLVSCMNARHTKHATYTLTYHFVWYPKYRKRILTGKIVAFVEQEICRICEINTWTSLRAQCAGRSVHHFLSASPSVAPTQIDHILKGTTAHRVFQHFPARQETALGRCTSRSRSYYVGSVGDMSVATVVTSIELGHRLKQRETKDGHSSCSTFDPFHDASKSPRHLIDGYDRSASRRSASPCGHAQ
jgi:putative transposase